MSVLFCEEILARVFSQDQVNATRCKKALAEKEAQDAQSPAHTRGHTKTVSHRHFLIICCVLQRFCHHYHLLLVTEIQEMIKHKQPCTAVEIHRLVVDMQPSISPQSCLSSKFPRLRIIVQRLMRELQYSHDPQHPPSFSDQ